MVEKKIEIVKGLSPAEVYLMMAAEFFRSRCSRCKYFLSHNERKRLQMPCKGYRHTVKFVDGGKRRKSSYECEKYEGVRNMSDMERCIHEINGYHQNIDANHFIRHLRQARKNAVGY